MRAFYEGIFEGFSELRLIPLDLVVEGDKLAACFRMQGKHTGAFRGAAASGRDISVDGITVMRFENGKCVERRSSMDFLGLLTQIGVLAPPGG